MSKENNKLSVPRPKEEIEREYTKLAFAAGNLAYRIEVDKGELVKAYDEMRKLNNEGHARAKLDSIKAEAVETAAGGSDE